MQFTEKSSRIVIEEQVNEIIKKVTTFSYNSSDLVEKCAELRSAVQNLFESYENSMSSGRMSTSKFIGNKKEFMQNTKTVRILV